MGPPQGTVTRELLCTFLEHARKLHIPTTIGWSLFALAQTAFITAHVAPALFYHFSVQADSSWWDGIKNIELWSIITKAMGIQKGQPISIVPTTAQKMSGITHLVKLGGSASEASSVAAWMFWTSGTLAPFIAFIMACVALSSCCTAKWLYGIAANLCRWALLPAIVEALLLAVLTIGNFTAFHGKAFINLVAYWVLALLGLQVLRSDAISAHSSGSSKWKGWQILRSLFTEDGVARLTTWLQSRKEPLVLMPILIAVLLYRGLHAPFLQVSNAEGPLYITDHFHKSFAPFEPFIKMFGMGEDEAETYMQILIHRMPVFTRSASLISLMRVLLATGHSATALGTTVIFISAFVLPVFCAMSGSALALLQHARWDEEAAVPLLSDASTTLGKAGRLECARLLARGLKRHLHLADLVLRDFASLEIFVVGVVLTLRASQSIGRFNLVVGSGFAWLFTAEALLLVHLSWCDAVRSLDTIDWLGVEPLRTKAASSACAAASSAGAASSSAGAASSSNSSGTSSLRTEELRDPEAEPSCEDTPACPSEHDGDQLQPEPA